MCGRFTQQRPASELARIFGAQPLVEDADARFNLAPTQKALVVVEREEERRVTAYRWGLVPSWAKDVSIGNRMINARAETVASTPAFRHAFEKKRCIVPADGFYEWRRDGSNRQPYLIRRADGQPMAFAGIWASWRDPALRAEMAEAAEQGVPGPEPLRSFSIVTTHSNELISSIHDRMPVILPPEAWPIWLAADPERPVDPGLLKSLLVPAPDDLLEMYPVSKLVNNVRSQGAALLDPIELPV
jgi:putative SOS response-associated peptidase YedK